MKRFLLFLLFFCAFRCVAQYQFIKSWDRGYGSYGRERIQGMARLSDGSFLLIGISNSNLGADKTSLNWDNGNDTADVYYDWWLLKLDSLGNKIWDKDFGSPGTNVDVPFAILEESDSVIYIGGGIGGGGDMTQQSRGGTDAWLVKINGDGELLWDYRYGTYDSDGITTAIRTSDKGFLLGIQTAAGIDGDKSQNNWDPGGGTLDYWVVKTDSNGNKEWDKRYGGTSQDFLNQVVQTLDGGYLLGGTSLSDSTGDKSMKLYNPDHSDWWVVRINASGNKIWDRRYGGTDEDDLDHVIPLKDGSFILQGFSASDTLIGDKTAETYGFWMIKIDSNGNKIWDKTIGPGTLIPGTLQQTKDNGFLISGNTFLGAVLDKTEPNLGTNQTWIVKTDSLFNKEWDKTIFTPGSELGYVVEASDNCYLVSNSSWNLGGYKTQPSWGAYSEDYWVMMFCMSPFNSVSELNDECLFGVYPNPFSSDVSFAVNKMALNYFAFTLYDLTGQKVLSIQESGLSSSYVKNLDLSYLRSGVYLLVGQIDGQRIFKRVIKQ